MNTTKELFDITEKELEIYKYLLKNPETNAVEIALNVKMQRPNVYDLLNNLLSKGLVSYSLKGKVKYYIGANPKKLKDIYEFKKEEFNGKISEVNQFVKSFSLLTKEPTSDLIVKNYEGLKGMRSVLMEALEETKGTGREMLVIRLNSDDLPKLDKTYTERFFNFRRKNKLKSRYLMLKNTKFYEDSLVKIKVISDKFESQVGIYIYGNSTSFWFFPKRELILVIENKEFTDTMRNNFEIMWKSN